MWFIALIAFLVGGASMPLPSSLGTSPAVTPTVEDNKCYRLEPDQKITLVPGSVVPDCELKPSDSDKIVPGGKTFIRIRQMVKIVNAKIVEGSSNWGTCNTTGPSGYGALRKVGPLPIDYSVDRKARVGDIFWEDMNYKHEDLRDFILVLTDKDNKYHTFEVYIDETKKDSIPDYVKNCSETGGLIPAPDVAAAPQFPPIAFATGDSDFNATFHLTLDKSCQGCETAFNNHKSELVNKYFLKMSKNDVPNIAEQVGIVSTTIDSETRSYDVFIHAGTVYLQGEGGQTDEGESWMYNASATKPPIEQPSHTESLKLKELKFVYIAPWTWATPECKPAIYLYPEKPMEVSIKVKPKGRIIASKPEHGKAGWKVIASPDGSIKSKVGEYPYLYYETKLDKVRVPEKGWIVEKKDLERFFNQLLPRLGLNQKEISDFLEYWVPKLSQKKRWFIALVARDELDRVEPIEFSTTPDTFIRIRFYFEELSEKTAPIGDIPLYLSDPGQSKILSVKNPARKGFTAVDWGGILGNGNCGIGEVSD